MHYRYNRVFQLNYKSNCMVIFTILRREKKQTNKQPFALLSVTKTYSLILIASSGFLFFRWSIKRSAYFSTIGKIWKKSDKKMSNCYA